MVSCKRGSTVIARFNSQYRPTLIAVVLNVPANLERIVLDYTTAQNAHRAKEVLTLTSERPCQQLASYPGLLTPVFVACSTNVGTGLVKLITCSDVPGHMKEWHIPSVQL